MRSHFRERTILVFELFRGELSKNVGEVGHCPAFFLGKAVALEGAFPHPPDVDVSFDAGRFYQHDQDRLQRPKVGSGRLALYEIESTLKAV
jgi:hypothetical protein